MAKEKERKHKGPNCQKKECGLMKHVCVKHSRSHKVKEEQAKRSHASGDWCSWSQCYSSLPGEAILWLGFLWLLRKERDATPSVRGGPPYLYRSSEIILAANKHRETNVNPCVLKGIPWQHSKSFSFEAKKKINITYVNDTKRLNLLRVNSRIKTRHLPEARSILSK